MLKATAVSQNGNYEKYYKAVFFDSETFKRARNLFDEYHANGVILNDSFDNEDWKLTNQLQSATISFRFNESSFQKNAKPWIGCDLTVFIKSVKTYAMFMLGSITINGIREVVRNFRLFVETPEKSLPAIVSEHFTHMSELLAIMPGGSTRRDVMLEIFEEMQWDKRERNDKTIQRVLSELGTYFRFDDALQCFWKSTSGEERVFWFPLYLWWTLTSILPLRTTEFLLTPRKCLLYDNGQNIITIRRTTLKGSGKKVAYRIDKDYEMVRYVVPDKMASEISWYMETTNSMEPSILSTLFVTEPHYAHFAKKTYGFGYYTYSNLSTCLRIFQEEVMGIDKHSKICLGDTRHLAMISLILSGGSPLVCKELAGHSDINISSRYYSNISSFIKCAVYEVHHKSRGWTADFTERGTTISKAHKKSVSVQGGFCDSEIYDRGEIYDCIKSIGINGEIGDCLRCPHFIDGNNGVRFLYSKPMERKEQVDKDSLYLMQSLESVRRGIGLTEDIQSALLRLQQSGSWYRRSLQRELEDGCYGKTKKADD